MDNGGRSTAFNLLHPEVQRWVWNQRWTELRQAQEQAAVPILRGDTDVIIAANTASGKTEAAFLPIASALANVPDRKGLVLYVSPLKALINDQYARLGPFFEHLDLPAWPWHGDVSASVKKRFRSDGRGVLLITPESLEGMFVRSGHSVHYLFRYLKYIVIDELHAFIGTERGKQVQSLLHRLEKAIDHEIPRIGLSATLGELNLAAEYLRPSRSRSVQIIESTADRCELKLLVRGYEERIELQPAEQTEEGVEHTLDGCDTVTRRIADDLHEVLHGTSNLVFANSRREVETYADVLRTRCEQQQIPLAYWPHHGSLSKELREQAEEAVKDKSRPATAICTSSLELGIDIGSVKSVAQVGSPFSVASLRQRLGRSGRRNEPAILRLYIREAPLTPRTTPVDAIRGELVQSISLIRLLLAKWCEPPEVQGLHLSTLVHQLLSLIAEKGGIQASKAWDILCREGTFHNVDRKLFAGLLRVLGEAGLLMQSGDGTLLHAPAGEKIVNHYAFGTVFQTPIEYRLVADSGKSLGTLPINRPLKENMLIIFAGRRWRVMHVEAQKRIIQVAVASGGEVPQFSGSSGSIHDRVRQEMRSVYEETVVPPYLDAQASEFLSQGREQFFRLGLHEQNIIASDGSSFFCFWRGDRVVNTVSVLLESMGLTIQNHGIAIEVQGISPANLRDKVKRLVESGPADPIALARMVPNKSTEKFHPFLTEDLLCADYAASNLDTTGAWQALANALGPGECAEGVHDG